MNSGATFKKFDLHLHAPGTGQGFAVGEQMDLNSQEERLAFARRYVQQAREVAGLDLIAITNHNDTSWVDPMRQAARDLYGDSLVVLPGVEVGTFSTPSIHLIALFEANIPVDWIKRFLDDVGLPDFDSRFEGNTVQPTKKSFPELLEAIEKRHGLAIAAHACKEDGLLHSTVRGIVKPMMFTDERLLAVEIQGRVEELDDWARYVVTNTHREHVWRRSRPIACLNSSDAKSLDEIGRRFTYVKCEQPSWEALRQALLDHEARLRLCGDPPVEPLFHLEHLDVAHTHTGFLRGLELTFNPCLNCLIGGRGTGKSAIIELLRYLWDQEPLRLAEMSGFVDVFFPETAEATLEMVKEQTRYRLRRRGRDDTRVERCEPDGTWLPVPNLRPRDLFPLDVYGQKEVLYTSEDVRSQLDLLDRLVGDEIERLKQERDSLLIDLRRNREAIIALYDRIEQLEHRLEGKGRIEEQLRQYHQLGLEEMAKTKRLYDRETQAWEIALDQADEASKTLLKTQGRVRLDLSYLSEEDLVPLPNRESLEALRTRMEQLVDALNASLDEAQRHVAQARADIKAARVEWEKKRDAFEDEYRQALSQLPGLTPDTVTRLERERMQLDLVEREMAQLKEEINQLLDERQELLRRLLDNDQRQYEVRQRKANEISSRLPRVRLRVAQGGDHDWLVEQLRRYLSGSRLRADDYLAIAQATSPNLLPVLAAIEAADPEMPLDLKVYDEWLPQASASLLPPEPLQNLTELCRLTDSNKAAKLVEYLPLPRRLELDEQPPPDWVTIELNIAREGERENWRPLGQRLGEGVSIGQGCTAILSIILLESKHPLIIDQPEDDLDNRFIYDEVVQILRRERGQRQMLVATHNANIPVAGDAELIVALDTQEEPMGGRTDLHCRVMASGFVDNPFVSEQVKVILEGGEAAFKLRQQKYGF